MAHGSQITLSLPSEVDPALLLGPDDRNLRRIRESFDASVTLGDGALTIVGDEIDVSALTALFSDLIKRAADGEIPQIDDVERLIDLTRQGAFAPLALREDILLTHRGRAIRPKTTGQKHYVDAIRTHTITFGIGPAGTGKTYLAVALAVAALKRREISRIILTRPIVEAGESLGYLPGTVTEKVDPYIRPLYDALYAMVDGERANALIESGTIEIAPLAYMRGRTLNDSFIILDEAQNTTPSQMKMFLTRLGFASKMIVTGDVSQIDLPHRASGLLSVRPILESLDDIAFCTLGATDVVRHSLVAKIVAAYDRYHQEQG